jgi:hypothetical protein
MARISGRKAVVTMLAAILLLSTALIAPGGAHDSESITHNWRRHYRPLAKKSFFTKRIANARFVNVGETATDAALLDGMDSTAFAEASHAHAGQDITSGTVADARIAATVARDSEVFGIVTASDGAGSGLNADLLDGQSSTDFAAATHAHAGEDITSGTVAEARIAAAIARVADVFSIVLANDGAGSGLDADHLDGLSSGDFALAGETRSEQWSKEAADTALGTTTAERVVFTAPEDLTITEILLEPAAALTASDTNYATLTVSRRDAGGGNRVTIDSATTQTTGTGSWTAFSTIPLDGVSNASVAAGQKVTIEISKTGLGVVVPVMVVQIEYTVD